MTAIVRHALALTDVHADTTAADSDPIPFADFAGGLIHVPAGEAVATLTFYAATSEVGTYVPVYDADGDPVSLAVDESRAYPIPDECFGAPWLKIVGNVDADLDLTLKG